MRQSASQRRSFVGGGSLLLAIAVALAVAVVVLVVFVHDSVSPAHADIDGAAMSLRVDVSQQTGCPDGLVAGKVCMGQGQKFDVIVVAATIPSLGYGLAQAFIDYDTQGLVHKKNTVALWPDCSHDTFLVHQDESNDNASAGCLTGLLTQPKSNHEGDLYSFSLTCTEGDSSSLIDLLPSGDAEAGTSGALYGEPSAVGSGRIVPKVAGIIVNCVPCPPQGCPTLTPTPTATPRPLPVGGVVVDDGLRPGAALEPESNSERLSWLVAAFGVMAAAMAVGAAAVVWRRR